MNHKIRGTMGVVIAFAGGCAVKPAAHNSTVATATAALDWLAQQPVVCGEVRGRVLDARTGAPLADVYVAIDSTSRAVSTDSLGQFRFNISPVDSNALSLTRAITLRIRRIGMLELRFHLHENLGYAVEASLGPQVFHVDGISTLRIKTPGFCERATKRALQLTVELWNARRHSLALVSGAQFCLIRPAERHPLGSLTHDCAAPILRYWPAIPQR